MAPFLTIVRATWNCLEVTQDVTDLVQSKVSGGLLDWTPTIAELGDPKPGFTPVLSIIYHNNAGWKQYVVGAGVNVYLNTSSTTGFSTNYPNLPDRGSEPWLGYVVSPEGVVGIRWANLDVTTPVNIGGGPKAIGGVAVELLDSGSTYKYHVVTPATASGEYWFTEAYEVTRDYPNWNWSLRCEPVGDDSGSWVSTVYSDTPRQISSAVFHPNKTVALTQWPELFW